MSVMDKNPPMGEVSPCGSLQDAPYDLGKGEFSSSEGENIKPALGRGGSRPGSGRPLGSPNKPKQRILQRATGPRWYAFKVKPSKVEGVVRDLLDGESRRGYIQRPPFQVYIPRTAVEVIRDGQRLTVQRNMFVGYGLTYFNHMVDPWPLIREVDGVLGIFTTHGVNPDTGYFTPIPLPEGAVEKLIEEAPKRLKLPEIRLPAYEPGQALRFESGPFEGHSAVCVACDGLNTRVFIQMFKERELELTRPRSELSLVEADRRSLNDSAR